MEKELESKINDLAWTLESRAEMLQELAEKIQKGECKKHLLKRRLLALMDVATELLTILPDPE